MLLPCFPLPPTAIPQLDHATATFFTPNPNTVFFCFYLIPSCRHFGVVCLTARGAASFILHHYRRQAKSRPEGAEQFCPKFVVHKAPQHIGYCNPRIELRINQRRNSMRNDCAVRRMLSQAVRGRREACYKSGEHVPTVIAGTMGSLVVLASDVS